MATSDKSGMTSAFDEMLERNQRELDALYSGPISTSRSPTIADASSRMTPPPATPPVSASRQVPGADERSSATVRNLTERYGDKWHYDVVDRRREGDEIIVLCKLSIEDDQISKAHFGSASIGAAGTKTAASAGGTSFSFGAAGESRETSMGDPEDLAYKRAVDAALAKCASLL